MKKISTHVQILLGIFLGFVFALVHTRMGWDVSIGSDYIKPIGTIFLNSLQAVSIPLIITSMVLAITTIDDTSKLSRITGKTFLLYVITTIFAVSFGLFITLLLQPGTLLSGALRDKLLANSGHVISSKAGEKAMAWKDFFLGLIPENIFQAFTDNTKLLTIVIISIIFGITLLRIPARKKRAIVLLFQGINEAFLEMIKMIMGLAPFGVFALISSLLIELGNGDIMNIWHYLYGMVWYVGLVLLSLGFMTFCLYPLLVSLFSNVGFGKFLRGIREAQLVAFSTSSSSATLPVTIEHVEQHLNVPYHISNFVVSLGATINMNGTALYQGIATLFIAQAYGKELTLPELFIVVLYVTVSAIGAAGIPGASLSSTIILLSMLGLDPTSIALISAPDRILDMCRTVTNVTGDAAVAVLVASWEGALGKGEDSELQE